MNRPMTLETPSNEAVNATSRGVNPCWLNIGARCASAPFSLRDNAHTPSASSQKLRDVTACGQAIPLVSPDDFRIVVSRWIALRGARAKANVSGAPTSNGKAASTK